MARLFNVILVLMSMDAICTRRVTNAPRLIDSSKMKTSYFPWPANTPLTLECNAVGTRPIIIRWYKDGKLIKPSKNISQDKKWSLNLHKPKRSDGGVYTCVVSNAYGMVKHNHSIRIIPERIQSAPVLVPGYPKPVTARVGDNVELECLEKPNVQMSDYRWVKTDSLIKDNPIDKDHVDIISAEKYKSFNVDEDDETKLHGVKLALQHVTQKDAGYYTCFLSNNDGFTHGTAYLNVTSALFSDPPEFLVPKHKRQHFIVGVEQEDVRFSCLVRGGEPLKYQWFYNGKLLKSNDDNEIESELIVRHVKRSDRGVYTCKIKNNYGHVRHSFILKVLARQPNYPVLLPGYPKDKTAMIGHSAFLYCSETTKKLVDYRWLKWEKSVKTFTKADLLNATKFVILHPKHYGKPPVQKTGVFLKLNYLTQEDEGLYTCLVTSHFGFSYRSAFLTIKQPAQEHFDQRIPVAILREKTTPRAEMTPTQVVSNNEGTSSSHRCYKYDEDWSKVESSIDTLTQCETTNACATISDENKGEQKAFCDEIDICTKYNVTSAECATVIFERPVVLCCCHDELCNQPSIKLFQKTKKTVSSWRPELMPVIFFSVLVLTISVMLALLGYRIRQRKAALKESIVHQTRPSSREMTKQKVMETRWLKEDI